MKRKRLLSLIVLIMILTTTVSGCGSVDNSAQAETLQEFSSNSSTVNLDISTYSWHWLYNEKYNVYELKNIVYCNQPVDAALQSMNIYVPASYMNSDGSLNESGTYTNADGRTYQTQTAPIIYVNSVWEYSEALPSEIEETSAIYLAAGFVVVSVGCRGKESVSGNGTYTGKAPQGIVDLKAGVRFLRFNDEKMAGNAEHIISVGQNAGGGMSALLGTTGNSPDYTAYLEEIGAVMDSSDEIYAAMVYCPITDLEHADMEYEWMFCSDTDYSDLVHGIDGNSSVESVTEPMMETSLNEFQIALSSDLAAMYPDYLNSLNLGITLNQDGRSGSYYDGIMAVISDALNEYLNRTFSTEIEKQEYIASLNVNTEWVIWNEDTKEAHIQDLDAFVTNYQGRLKEVPGFDAVDMSAQENQLFGSENKNLSHFSESVTKLLNRQNYSALDGFSLTNAAMYAMTLNDSNLQQRIYLMNPMNYIGDADSTLAPYFRIRMGAQDADSTFATAYNLATAIEQAGSQVDYKMLWGQSHGMADYEGELVQWIDQICEQ